MALGLVTEINNYALNVSRDVSTFALAAVMVTNKHKGRHLCCEQSLIKLKPTKELHGSKIMLHGSSVSVLLQSYLTIIVLTDKE